VQKKLLREEVLVCAVLLLTFFPFVLFRVVLFWLVLVSDNVSDRIAKSQFLTSYPDVDFAIIRQQSK
jgi:hypothetical protein